jgi:holliday junction DNA helicase RuvA
MSIAFLNGKVLHKSTSWIILDVNGVGYKVEMNTDGIQVDSSLRLYIYHHVREDAQKLFGFKRVEELELFELLISVSGIGPKSALTVITSFSVENLLSAIKSEDVATIALVKGLGKKSAERIILELKGKIEDFALTIGIGISSETGVNKAKMQKDFDTIIWQDAKDALTSLGYSKDEVAEAFSKVYETVGEEEASSLTSDIIVRKALSYLS